MKNKKAFFLHLAIIGLVLGCTLLYAGCMGINSESISLQSNAEFMKTADNTSGLGIAGQATNCLCSGCLGQCGVVTCETCAGGCFGCVATCEDGCMGCVTGCNSAMNTVNNQ